MVSKVTLSGYILNYVITPVSDYVVNCLLEGYQQSVILADLVYLSQEFKDNLEQKDRTWKELISITNGDY
ncbi:hypothetical protein J5568_04240 [Streptococcus suis]|nr:hypothetical protein [Streptococcus suis]MBO4133050.1 hypothetical protein [Streptococcus suis]MCK3923892.1 hypothetical protein [Streptococcus suis]MCK4019612.1 hypothetical protein [Streptococcus suis]NQK13092.1 hypothetical protein [Streptococcus suis]